MNAVSKINSGVKPPRKLGEPIKELSTLKRQRTPPIKSERDAEKLRKLKLKTSSQPNQNDRLYKNQKTKRQSLLYEVKKELNLNTGDQARGGKSNTSVK